jgi:hypothetical protein
LQSKSFIIKKKNIYKKTLNILYIFLYGSIYSTTGALVYQSVATSEEMDIPLKAEGV